MTTMHDSMDVEPPYGTSKKETLYDKRQDFRLIESFLYFEEDVKEALKRVVEEINNKKSVLFPTVLTKEEIFKILKSEMGKELMDFEEVEQ